MNEEYQYDKDHPLHLFPVVIDIPIRWGDMDAFQHVNNVTYFQYFESARIAYMEALNIEEYMKAEGVGPILGHASCQFKFPLTYPDLLKVGARTSKLENDRFYQAYIVFSPRHNRIAAEGTGIAVNYDYTKGEKAEIPEEVVERILALEGGELT